MARRVFQIGTAAARRAAAHAGHGTDPMSAARNALIAAAKVHTPGVLSSQGSARRSAPQRFRDRKPARTGQRRGRPRYGYGGVAYGHPLYVNGSSTNGAPEPGAVGEGYDSNGFPQNGDGSESGQWVRRGRNIILIGV